MQELLLDHRLKLTLALTQRATELLVQGFGFVEPGGLTGAGVASVYFADDGAYLASSFEMLQLMFDVSAAVARVTGLDIGIKSDGSKTAWSGTEWRPDGSCHTCDDGRTIRLQDTREVPRVEWYKHLGTQVEARQQHELPRKRCERRCRGARRNGLATADVPLPVNGVG